MLRVYRKFLESPTRTTYLAVRDRLLHRPHFPSQIDPLLAISNWLHQGEHARALSEADRLVPEWILSPRWHFFRACAAESLGDRDLEGLARFEMAACRDGLLATGNGSESDPFVVTYLSDVLDLLQFQRQTPSRRGVIATADSLVDVVTCASGEKRYFCHPPWTHSPHSMRSAQRTLTPLHA